MAPEFTKSTHRALASAAAGCLITLALSAAIGAAPARAAAAEPAAEPPAIEVSYDDLDLSTERGAQALLERIRNAARQVCPVENIRNLGAFMASRSCERLAIARAVQRVGSPRLAALYTMRARHG